MGESRAFSREDANLAELWIESASNSTLIPVMVTRHFGRWVLRGLLALGIGGLFGCSHAVSPVIIEDAQLGVRVKTAIVNDPELGTRAIEVRVAGGVAQLSGRVQSEEEADRLIRLVRSVRGVRDVRSDVHAGPAPAVPTTDRLRPAAVEPIETPGDPRLIAVGGSVAWVLPRSDGLLGAFSFGPLLRVGSGDGLALAIDFNWVSADIVEGPGSSAPLGRLHVRPLMGGAGYTVQNNRVSAGLTLVAGYSFNSVSVNDLAPGRILALRADNSFAFRPGMSLWFDVSRRIAFSAFAGYLLARPSVTFLEDGRVTRRTIRGDTVLVSTGIVYKLF